MSYEQYVPYTPAETRYDKMPYRRCGRSGLKLPAISLGLWHNFGDITPFGTQEVVWLNKKEYEQEKNLLDSVLNIIKEYIIKYIRKRFMAKTDK